MSESIQILPQIEAVRKNPWMYIGSIGKEGVHQLLLELVHNSLDEALMGFADRIGVRIGSDYIEVQDNGRGISTEIHPTEGLPDCEVALTRLHAGSKFNKAPNEFTAGLHGVGLSCVNALSSNLKITIDRNGQRFEQEYAKGVTCSPLRRLGQMHTTGTTVRFWPDVSIFKNFVSLNKEDCRQVLQVLAWLHPEVEFSFFDDERGVSESFANQGGVEKILEMDIKSKRCLFLPPVNIELSGDSFKMNALFVWTTESDTSIRSYVNGIHTTHGGTHVNAFKAGISRAVHQMARQFDGGAVSSNSYFELNEIIEGLVAVVICQLSQPNFEGQTKTRLTNANIGEILEIETAKKLTQYFSEHPHESKVLFERMRQSRNVRASVRRIADRIFLQNNQLKINEEVYKAQFGARSRNWHSSAVWITDSALLEKHAEQCEVGEGALALDVCCGSGVVGASFKSKVSKVIGLDLTPEMVALARERLDEVHQGNVYQLPFADNKFDLVCTREVLHLLPYPEKPVSEIWRVMKPGGQFVVGQILPFGADDAVWMYRVFKKKQPLIYNMFQEEDFRQLLIGAGFVDLKMTEINVWESIDVWINSVETSSLHRHEIREMFLKAPSEARAVHPFKILPSGEIHDLWRWCIFSVRKPL